MSVATKETSSAAGGGEPASQEPSAEGAVSDLPANDGATSGFAKRGAIYTMTALEGLDAADLVKAAFSKRTIGAATPRRLEVLAPDGPSTAGGRRARQAIRLVPVAAEGAPVMCGFLDVAKKLVELRSYAMVAQQYAERFGSAFDVTAPEYAALCKELESTLAPFRYEFSMERESASKVDAARANLSSRAGSRGIRALNSVIIALVALILAALAISMLRR